MITEEFSEAAFNDLLVNLNIDDNTPGKTITVTPETRDLVQTGLERTLIDVDAMRAYLRQLDAMKLPRPLKHDELLPDGEVADILKQGLADFSDEALAALALNPLAMLDLRDRLEDEELSEHWWSVATRFNPETAAIEKVFEARADELDQIVAGKTRSRDPALVPFDQIGDESQEGAPPAPGQRSWYVSVPLEGAEWLSISDAERVAELRQATLDVEFTWKPEASAGTLVVRPGPPLLLTSDVVCTGRLLDSSGQSLADTSAAERQISFRLLADQWNSAATLQLDYDRNGRFHLRCHIQLGREQHR